MQHSKFTFPEAEKSLFDAILMDWVIKQFFKLVAEHTFEIPPLRGFSFTSFWKIHFGRNDVLSSGMTRADDGNDALIAALDETKRRFL